MNPSKPTPSIHLFPKHALLLEIQLKRQRQGESLDSPSQGLTWPLFSPNKCDVMYAECLVHFKNDEQEWMKDMSWNAQQFAAFATKSLIRSSSVARLNDKVFCAKDQGKNAASLTVSHFDVNWSLQHVTVSRGPVQHQKGSDQKWQATFLVLHTHRLHVPCCFGRKFHIDQKPEQVTGWSIGSYKSVSRDGLW